jgi:tRNA G37 N-methylase Trm5
VLKELLPSDVEIIGGFETIGDIAHLNLNEKQMAHKFTIG